MEKQTQPFKPKDSYLTQLEKEIQELETNIKFYRRAFSDTFVVGYTESDQWKKIYDYKISIDFLHKFNTGWKIEFSNNSITIEKSNQKVISFIGNKSKGKTYVYNLLTSDAIVEQTGPTKGLCIKTIDDFKTYMDIPGGDSFNFFNESSDEMQQNDFTSKFLEDFMIEVSNILILVVGRMTVQDIQFLKNIQSNVSDKKVIVIHNMSMITQEKDYNDFVKIQLKNYGFDLNDIHANAPYYIQTNSSNSNSNSNNVIVHMILANHYSQYYKQNCEVIQFIKTLINSSKATRQFDVIESLKWFIVNTSWKYFGQQIEAENIECSKTMIKFNQKDFTIKPHTAFFTTDIVTHNINLCYHYYYTDKTFVIQIELSNECSDLHSNVKIVSDKYIFQVYGVKKEMKPDVLPKNKENENNVSLFQYGQFLLRVAVPFSDGRLANTYPKAVYQDGILSLSYDLLV